LLCCCLQQVFEDVFGKGKDPIETSDLLKTGAILLAMNQFFEDREHLFTIAVNTLQILLKSRLKARRAEPLIQKRLGDVNVTPQRVHRVSPEEKPIKHGSFALRSERVEIVPELYVLHRKPPPLLLQPYSIAAKREV
jgi:hypothetical protein